MMSALKSRREVRTSGLCASFPWVAVRLVSSILAEGVATLARLAVFPLHRRSARAKIRGVLLGLPPKSPALRIGLLGCCLALLVAALGCETMPGSSFSKQVEETQYSVEEIIGMHDSPRSLEDDLRDFASGISVQDMLWDIEQILGSPDAQGSLSDDLGEFADIKATELPESLEMLGW